MSQMTRSVGRRILAQARLELMLTLRRGESVLVAFLVPIGILVFFAKVDAVNTPLRHPVDFLVPGVLALAVMSRQVPFMVMVLLMYVQIWLALLVLQSHKTTGVPFTLLLSSSLIRNLPSVP